jgi:Holliday junction resolvase-like predicted endonuclease
VLARNLAVDGGEIDLVVQLGGVQVAVEVRSVLGRDPAVLAFDGAKADRVWRLARRTRPPCARVDLVAVRFDRHGVDVHWVPGVS